MKNHKIIQKIATIAILTSMAIVLSIVESFIPSIGLQGVKLGLANIAIILVLYGYGFFYALGVTLLRVIVSSLILGNIFQMGFFMSLTGAILSLIVMFIIKKIAKNLTVIVISVIGSIFHVSGQIVVAMIYMNTWTIIYYYPVIFLSSIITGIFVGIVAKVILSTSIFKKLCALETNNSSSSNT